MSIERNGLVTNRKLYQIKKVALRIENLGMSWSILVQGFAAGSRPVDLEALHHGGFDRYPIRKGIESHTFTMIRPISPNRNRSTFPFQETRDFILGKMFPRLQTTSPRDILLFARSVTNILGQYKDPNAECLLWDLNHERYTNTRGTMTHPAIGHEVVQVDLMSDGETSVAVVPDLVIGPTRDWLLFMG